MSDLRILAALPLIVAGEVLATLTEITDRAAAYVVGLDREQTPVSLMESGLTQDEACRQLRGEG